MSRARKSSRAGGGWFRKRKYLWLSYLFPRRTLLSVPAKPYHRIVASLRTGVSLQSNRDNGTHFVRDSFQYLIAATPLFPGSLVFSVEASLA